MKKVVKVELSESGIDNAIRELRRFEKMIKEGTPKLLKTLGEMGLEIATANFQKAQYDGTNDVSVKVEERGESSIALIAVGGAVLFIEFGTGVVYPDGHPEQQFVRGTYGKGHGSQQAWGYYGDPGTNGVIKRSGEKGDVVITHGNASNMSMYNTKKELQERIEEIARRCYTW